MIDHLKHSLKWLSVANNLLHDIPEGLAEFDILNYLDLSRNIRITSIRTGGYFLGWFFLLWTLYEKSVYHRFGNYTPLSASVISWFYSFRFKGHVCCGIEIPNWTHGDPAIKLITVSYSPDLKAIILSFMFNASLRGPHLNRNIATVKVRVACMYCTVHTCWSCDSHHCTDESSPS